jgi:hypothetical protein
LRCPTSTNHEPLQKKDPVEASRRSLPTSQRTPSRARYKGRTTQAESPTGRNVPLRSADKTSDSAAPTSALDRGAPSGAAPDVGGRGLTRLAEGSRPTRTLPGPRADQTYVPRHGQYETRQLVG